VKGRAHTDMEPLFLLSAPPEGTELLPGELSPTGLMHPDGAESADPVGGWIARFPRAKRWAKEISAYFSAQALTQMLGLGAGLLLVRSMPVQQFALYTLALSVVTFFTFVSDLGSTTSLLYFFHRTRGDQLEFSRYFAAVRSLRRLAFLAGSLAVSFALPGIASSKGFASRDIALTTAAVLLCVWFQISSSLSVLALRLADRYGASYRAEIAGGGVRLVAAALQILTSRLYSWLAVLGNSLAVALTSLLARPEARKADPSNADLAPYRRRVVRYLLPTLPSALYFSIQTPLTVWLSATFGATRNIAEVGALSRLGLVVGLFSNLSAIVLLPRLAQTTDERLYRVRSIQFFVLLITIALLLYGAVLWFPDLLLKLLGEHYSHLHRELLLVVAGSGLTLLGGYVVGVNLARSWTRQQAPAMLVLIVTQAILVKALPLSSTRGVLVFNLLSALTGLLMQLAITILGFTKPKIVHWE
jgi:O-antigen/teichoic acid export membrane protein